MRTRTKIAGSVVLAYSTGSIVLYTLQKINRMILQDYAEVIAVSEQTHQSRHLLEIRPTNCSPAAIESFPRPFISDELARQGGMVVYILIALYAFLALAVVTDVFFLGTLERIVEVLNINPDVAAATFMAAGSSAPELGTGLLAVFITKDDIGVGTVVGSAVYNVAFVVALCAIFAGKVIHVNWWPLCRDCFFYFISIITLMAIMWDKHIEWSDSLVLLLLYIIYIGFMYVNARLEKYFTNLPVLSFLTPPKTMNPERITQTEGANPITNGHVEIASSELTLNVSDLTKVRPHKNRFTKAASYTVNKLETTEEEEEKGPLSFPEGMLSRIIWIIILPGLLLFSFTIPNCKTERWKNWFWLSFLVSCAWISSLTYVLVWMITIIGDLWHIPDAVMGLTFLAAGASVPDTLASIFVAREGKGNMAISNAVGSNVFDILICLGLPWFLQTAIVQPGSRVPVYAGGMVYTILCLLATIVILVLATHFNGWKLDKKLGAVMLMWYFVFMVITILYQMNVFSQDNLPVCKRN